MSNRDPDPPESQVRILYGKNGGRCAYPKCGSLLVMESKHPADRSKNLGKVAHITAASRGGPRYDERLTTAQRQSETNLILLCGDHHDTVDSQINLHTADWLREAKTANEAFVTRGYYYAMGKVGFDHLEIVCKGISLVTQAPPIVIENLTIPIPIEEKITINTLGSESRNLVQLGLAQQMEVRSYIEKMDQVHPNFALDLAAKFKAIYYEGWSDRLRGDELFRSVMGAAFENCGPRLTPEVGAAALAVVVDLFVICEIFEYEHSATR